MAEKFEFFIQNCEQFELKIEPVEEYEYPLIDLHSMMEAEDDNFDFSGMPDLIKIEPFEDEQVYISRPLCPEDIPFEDRHKYRFKCKICDRIFSSKYAFTLHVNKHTKKCANCKLIFKTWKEVEVHRDFCSRKNGRNLILPRKVQAVTNLRVKSKKLPYECQLCHRKYEFYDHFYKHQRKRCARRFVSWAWILKI
jgi:uncharacterized C2H2 Zn-finger protein